MELPEQRQATYLMPTAPEVTEPGTQDRKPPPEAAIRIRLWQAAEQTTDGIPTSPSVLKGTMSEPASSISRKTTSRFREEPSFTFRHWRFKERGVQFRSTRLFHHANCARTKKRP